LFFSSLSRSLFPGVRSSHGIAVVAAFQRGFEVTFTTRGLSYSAIEQYLGYKLTAAIASYELAR
jgi:hypothetical protein